jgi:AcrR family transcriptional regulator
VGPVGTRSARRLPPEQRREQLLDAATDLAGGRDLATLSVQDIARHAGVSEGLLYHYFPTKQALLLAAAARAAARMTAALEAAGGDDPREVLLAGLRAYLDHVRDDPAGWRVLLQAQSGEPARIAAAVDERSRSLALQLMGVVEPSPALLLAVDGFLALEKQVCRTWLDHPEVPRAAVEDLLATTFLRALEAAARHDEQARAAWDRLAG